MHILFIFEKYDNPKILKLANSYNTLIGTYVDNFKNDPSYTYKHYSIAEENSDDGDIKNAEQLNQVLLNENFDIAIVSMHRDVVVELDVAKKLGKKLILIYWDTHLAGITSNPSVNFRLFKKKLHRAHVFNKYTMDEYSQYCNCVATDYGFGEEFKNIYGMTGPQIESLMKPRNIEKKYDVSFIGSMNTFERKQIVDHLLKNNINIKLFGGRDSNEKYLTVEDYSIKINETKINLNLNHSNICPHRKGRAYEIAACGGFMLSTYPEVYYSKNGVHLKDGIDFISVNMQNIVQTIEYYLKHEDERNQISNNLKINYVNNLNTSIWWEKIFRMVEE